MGLRLAGHLFPNLVREKLFFVSVWPPRGVLRRGHYLALQGSGDYAGI